MRAKKAETVLLKLLNGHKYLRFQAIVLCAPLVLSACSGSAPPQAPASPPLVTVTQISEQNVRTQSTFTGRVEAISKVDIRARVEAFIVERPFTEGSEVKKGDVLYNLQRDEYEIALRSADASLDLAKAAEVLSERSFYRAKDLLETGAGTQANYDSAASDLQQKKATVAARQSDRDNAALNLSYTRLTAPNDGKVGRSAYPVGELVNSTSSPLVTLVSQDPMYITFPISQRALLDARRDNSNASNVYIEIVLADGSVYDHKGQISFADATSNVGTDSVLIRALIANPKRTLIDQQLVDVRVLADNPDLRLVVPVSALLVDQQGTYVLIVGADGKAVPRYLQLGAQNGIYVVVEKGLSKGDLVISDGQQNVRQGQEVKTQPAAPIPINAAQMPSVPGY